MSRQFLRCLAVAPRRRGNHSSGAEHLPPVGQRHDERIFSERDVHRIRHRFSDCGIHSRQV